MTFAAAAEDHGRAFNKTNPGRECPQPRSMRKHKVQQKLLFVEFHSIPNMYVFQRKHDHASCGS